MIGNTWATISSPLYGMTTDIYLYNIPSMPCYEMPNLPF
jgi:hypothetical protein